MGPLKAFILITSLRTTLGRLAESLAVRRLAYRSSQAVTPPGKVSVPKSRVPRSGSVDKGNDLATITMKNIIWASLPE